ncbi:hypothetical protein KUTeg_004143 [Tegillarca granosa]|uniref:Ig-like domain-containing protein n=1 Tax=Tegillarca granosa TaxID=220873 RepID=A0ABQ9FQY1_TEGGR|nr:hypothetical protein KUTeg_004143 [Tegillarca granosa]
MTVSRRNLISYEHNVQCEIIFIFLVKAPKIKKIKGKKSVKEGRTIQLRCQIGPAKPQPKIYWEKDGVILKKGKGIQIKSGRKGSRLRVKKSKPTDSGNYVCVVKNAVSTDRMAINIRKVQMKVERPEEVMYLSYEDMKYLSPLLTSTKSSCHSLT